MSEKKILRKLKSGEWFGFVGSSVAHCVGKASEMSDPDYAFAQSLCGSVNGYMADEEFLAVEDMASAKLCKKCVAAVVRAHDALDGAGVLPK